MSTPHDHAAAAAAELTTDDVHPAMVKVFLKEVATKRAAKQITLTMWDILCFAAAEEIQKNAPLAQAAKDAERALEAVEIMEEYNGKDGRRQWAESAQTWLRPNQAVAQVYDVALLKAALAGIRLALGSADRGKAPGKA